MSAIEYYFSQQSEQTMNLLYVAIFLAIVFVVLGKYIDRQEPMKRPSKIMVVIDMYYGFITNLYDSIYKGHCKKTILPYVSMLIIFILTMNWLGLFTGLSAPATDYNVPLGLALISFGFKYAYEFKYVGVVNHMKGYLDPVAVMLPLNLMDIIAKPLSMSMRLFGNLLAGSLILAIFYSAMGGAQNMLFALPVVEGFENPIFNFLGAIVAPPLHFYFDVFSGVIQAFVFTLLTLIFSSIGLDFDDMDEKAKAKQLKEESKQTASVS
ncbi:F0F1 ATP synthase subunit A [Erysipelotrichaceae bacterium OttesenSCG-928-M19]|nr:F0F1 ATP synthase subunit A [Erysipelotrichaceae bacterium OttesenSCG-928-M19]